MTLAAVAPLLNEWADSYGVPRNLVYGLVAQESNFDPQAYRAEPKVNDASRGLTQILYHTAQGMGYTGTPDELYDPATNLDYGLRYLVQQITRAGGDIPAALSAYNGGWRPLLGYGVRLMTGLFANQAYVEGVLAKAVKYGYTLGSSLGPLQLATTAAGGSGSSLAGLPWWLALAVLGMVLAGARRTKK